MENFRTFDLLPRLQKNYNKPDALSSKVNGSWKKISTDEYIKSTNNISFGLLAWVLAKGIILELFLITVSSGTL